MSSRRKWIVALLKWSLTLAVLAFVGVRAAQLWRQGSAQAVELCPGWLVASGGLYLLGWLPSVWFWRRLLARMGDRLTWPAVARAYYCGHLGKYVPGKALVPIIRGQLVAAAGGRFRIGALSAVYETLVMMAGGAAVAAGLLAFLLPAAPPAQPGPLRTFMRHPTVQFLLAERMLLPGLVLVGVAVSLPLAARLFSVLSRKFAPVEGRLPQPIDARLIGEGLLMYAVGWMFHGLSLYATLRGVGADVGLYDLPAWTATVALAATAGFAALFAPGGVGVREALLIEFLRVRPDIGPTRAVAAALLLRCVWLLAEVAAAGLLYYGVKPQLPATQQSTGEPRA